MAFNFADIAGSIGNAIDTYGRATKQILPDFGISERLESFGGNYGVKPAQASEQNYSRSGFTQPNSSQQNYTSTSGGYTPTGGGSTGGGQVPQQPSGGGGSGQTQGPSDADIMAEINNAYNEQMNYLGQAEGNLRGALPGYIGEAEGNFNVNQQLLKTGRDKSMGQADEQGLAAGERKEDALTAARRLYNELQQRGQQQFGGASSAGQAFGEISAREQQRQSGDIQKQFATAQRQIEQSRMDIDQKFNDDTMVLQQQKQTAIAEINRNFQNQMLEIGRLKSEAGSNKAQMRLSALQDLRNQVFQVNLQEKQFQQSLEAQRQAAMLSVGQNANALAGFNQMGQQGVSSFNQNTTTNPQGYTPSYNAQGSTQSYTGQINPGRDDEDILSRLMPGLSSFR